MPLSLLRCLLLVLCAASGLVHAANTDPVADNMLLLQTPSGGWSKHYREKKVDYARDYDAAERAALRAPDRYADSPRARRSRSGPHNGRIPESAITGVETRNSQVSATNGRHGS